MPFHEGHDVDMIAERCDYIVRHNLRGGMYWEWNCEQGEHPMAKACSEKLRAVNPSAGGDALEANYAR